VACGILLRI